MGRSAGLELGGVRWWLGPQSDPERSAALLEGVDRALARGATDLKRGRRKQLYRLALAAPLPDHLLKLNLYPPSAGWLRRLARSKSRRELVVAGALAARGIATPVPVAAGEERRWGLLRSCRLLVPIVGDALDLRRLWLQERASPGERRAWARALGELARRMHDAGVLQEDFAPNNFLVRRGPQPQLLSIDFERTRLRAHVGRRARRRMLAKLDRHLTGSGAPARMRFLLAYVGGEREQARRWWRELEAEGAALARRDFRRMRRTGTRAGRRFRPVRWRGWRGWARRDAWPPSPAALEADPSAPRPGAPAWIREQQERWLWLARGIGMRRARRVWAVAQLLWLRGGLGAEPLVLIRRGDAARLWLRRAPGTTSLAATRDPDAARRAATVLFDRLLALGRVEGALGAEAIGLRAGPGGALQAFLLDPGAFRPGRPCVRGRRRRARQLARGLGRSGTPRA